ncbi:FecCD family ABC transporter permease [Clostridium sp. 'White wine YQ']|uniref:FecCD family ABC transporter permease n=1 Tax=Clostridium sp. 'White wine YQ' TaxID=3027474 RepID=UPI002366D0EB|nr:iron ABC transporter permease [Clostridium sp. 'White wine YQ']MDD7794984.1 iron ABC transporter permease [Clostridium sp. 'White wine YQ']
MKHRKLFFIVLILLVILSVYSLTLGAADISFTKVLAIIKDTILGKYNGDIMSKIIVNIRGPRILMAMLTGIGLAVSGAAFQGIFKNSMGDPYVLGVSSGAALGAAVGLVFNLESSNYIYITLLAFIGAITTMLLVYNIAKVGGRIPTETLLLSGIAVNFLFSSLISLLMILKKEAMDKIIFWTLGSFNSSSYSQVLIVLPIVFIGGILIYSKYKDINILSLGEESAYSLGVQGENIKKFLVILSSLIVATLVSFSGIIGFVGLVIPHIVRIIVGSNNREVIPFSALFGGIFLVICDTIARTVIPPTELPVGAITALIGAPYFMYLLVQKKRG